MKRLFFGGLILLSFYASLAQNRKLDSLYLAVKNATNDSLLFDAYSHIASEYSSNQPDSTMYYAKRCENIAKKNSWKTELAIAYNHFGYSYLVKQEFDSCVSYYEKTLPLFRSAGKRKSLTIMLNNLATRHIDAGKYKKAYAYLDQGKTICEEDNDLDMLSSIYISYGLIDDYKGNYDSAYTLYTKAYDIAVSIKSERQQVIVKNNIGLMYYYKGDYAKAIPYFRNGISYWKKENDLYQLCESYRNIGVSYDQMNVNDSALYYTQLALDIDIQLGSKYNQAKGYHNIGVIYEKMNQDDLALKYFEKSKQLKESSKLKESTYTTYHYLAKLYLKKGNTAEALPNLMEEQRIATLVKSKEGLKDNAILFNEYYEMTNNFEQALIYHKKYKALSDTLYNLETEKLIEETEAKYKTVEQQKTIVEQELEIANQEKSSTRRMYLAIVAGLLSLLAAITAFFFYRRKQTSEKYNQELTRKNEKITILNKDIVHRTSNYLKIITSILKDDIREAEDTQTYSTLLKQRSRVQTVSSIHTLLQQQNDQKHIPIKQYLQELCAFLQDLYAEQHNNLSIQVEEIGVTQLDASDAANIGLIVNELVTNATKYAFVQQEQPEIKVSLRQEQEDYILQIQDNGIGLSKEEKREDAQGFELIQKLVEQLRGTLQFKNLDGLLCSIQFQPKTIS